MRENRGPEARMVETIKNLRDMADRVPRLIAAAEIAAARIAGGSIRLDPDTVRALRGGSGRYTRYAGWLALAIALAALVISLN